MIDWEKQITDLADACNAGACNVTGLVRGLARVTDTAPNAVFREHPALPVILGHLNFLVGQGPGPDVLNVYAYEKYRQNQQQAQEVEVCAG
jgi:hypothetical protein